MFAPVVSRFVTYGVGVSATSEAYMQTVLRHPAMQAWFTEGEREVEIVEEAEAGVEV